MSDGTGNGITATRRQPLWPGAIVLAACVAGAVVLAVPGLTGGAGQTGTLYDHSRWLLLALLAAAGVGLLVRRRIVITQISATLGVITAVQLITTGIVAAKHWRPLSGFGGVGDASLSTLILLAWVLIAAAGIATVACLMAARASGLRRNGVPNRYRWIGLAVGAILAAALPPILGVGQGQTVGLRSLAAYALLYSLPWGAAIAVSGWLNRTGAVTAVVTVAVCVASAAISHAVLWVAHPARGFVPTFALAVVLVAGAATREDQARQP